MAAKKKPRRHRKKQSLALRIESVRDSALVAKHQAAALCEKALEGIDSEDFSGEEFLPLLERFSQPKAVIWVVLHLNSYTETLEKLKSMVEQIEKISSHDWLVAEQWIDFLELEMKLPELREEILTRMQGDLEAVQAKFEAIMKSRMAAQIELFLQKNKCGKVEEAEEILCLQALLISLEMNGRKSRSTDSAWRQNVLQSKSVHEFKILLRKLCDIQVSEMIPAWDDLSKFWINAVAYSTRLTDLAPVILFLEYFLNEADTSQEWQCQKIPWSSAGLKLSLNHPESTALLYFIQILILVESVCSISGLNHFELEQFLTHRDSLSLEMLCSALLNVVVDLENSSPLKFVNAWKNLSFVWKARISNCDSFCAFAELLFELESYIRVCAFEHHWFEIRPSWLKCLNLTSISIEKIKSLALRFESCINGKSFKVEFQDPSIRRQWRYHASNSSNVLDIGNLIVDLESRIDPMHYGLIWKDYRSFWRYNAKATVFPSQLAFSISEMYSLTQIPVIKGWAENHQRFVTELKDLAIGDSFGRNSIVQGMIFFFKLCLAEENFSDGNGHHEHVE